VGDPPPLSLYPLARASPLGAKRISDSWSRYGESMFHGLKFLMIVSLSF
jgi:hypothetical protein